MAGQVLPASQLAWSRSRYQQHTPGLTGQLVAPQGTIRGGHVPAPSHCSAVPHAVPAGAFVNGQSATVLHVPRDAQRLLVMLVA
jgi:hypothetical protein